MNTIKREIHQSGSSDMLVRYSVENGSHVIRVRMGKHQSSVNFPSQSEAMNFMQRISFYGKLKGEL